MSQSDSFDWIVVRTQPNRESTSLRNLDQQGYTTYCPMIRRRIRHARRAYDALRPLFTSYVFVRNDASARFWRPMLSTIGVSTVVRNGERPALLSGEIIRSLQEREVDGAIVNPETPFKKGQSVRVQGGPLDSLVGTILETRDNQRHLILLELLKSTVKAQVPQDFLRPIDGNPGA